MIIPLQILVWTCFIWYDDNGYVKHIIMTKIMILWMFIWTCLGCYDDDDDDDYSTWDNSLDMFELATSAFVAICTGTDWLVFP